jgi:hypothetical protein
MAIERLLATHEQLLERVRRLDPGFVPRGVSGAVPIEPRRGEAATPFAEMPRSALEQARADEEAFSSYGPPDAMEPAVDAVPREEAVPREFVDDHAFGARDVGDGANRWETSSPEEYAHTREGEPLDERPFADPGEDDAPIAATVDNSPGGVAMEPVAEPSSTSSKAAASIVASADPSAASSAKPTEEPEGIESRVAPRKASKTPALAVFETSPSGTPCTIVDMSATGARLRFPPRGSGYTDPSNIPSRFWLQIKLDRMQVECEVVRIVGEEMGVRFVSVPQPLAKPAPRKADAAASKAAVRAAIAKRR